MKTKNLFVLTFVFLIFIFSFQNCTQSPPIAFSETSSNKPFVSEGNGQGYDGKIYLLMGDICTDGTRLRSRIVVNSSVSADLTRRDCEEIEPVPLGPNEFYLNPNNEKELMYQNQVYINALIGTKIDMSLVTNEAGYCYMLSYDFGAPADTNATPSISTLQVYEDGKPIGPAHSRHDEIRNFGLGRFSHWNDSGGGLRLRFSASDNSNPLTNGRTYTWEIK